jgi:mRNA interferase MazF
VGTAGGGHPSWLGCSSGSRSRGRAATGTSSSIAIHKATQTTQGIAVKQYEIWWADLPAPSGRRPVMLLTRSDAYRYLKRVIAVEITTREYGIAQELVLGSDEGLHVRCVARFDNLVMVPVRAIRRRVGRLPSVRIPGVKRALGAVLDWPELVQLA